MTTIISADLKETRSFFSFCLKILCLFSATDALIVCAVLQAGILNDVFSRDGGSCSFVYLDVALIYLFICSFI